MKKHYEDDGRTIADMSGLERPGMLFPRRAPKNGADSREGASTNNDNGLTRSERNHYIMGAVGAALAIVAVFGAVFGLAIWLMTLLWS